MRMSRLAGLCSATAIALIAAVVVVPSANAAPAAPDWGRHAAPSFSYYLSLGDSLGFGYSEANLTKFESDGQPFDFHGYTQDLAGSLGLTARTTNLSCPGESTASMISGPCPAASSGLGTWPYDGSQLSAATAFLSHYRWWDRGLITVSIGSNDVLPVASGCLTDPACPGLGSALKTMRSNLSTILSRLRSAAPLATIVVLAPYNPFGFAYPISNVAAVAFDLSIAAVAVVHFDRVADAFAPINITDAAQHCTLIYYGCTGPFAGDVHPTAEGYAVIAQAFEKALR